MTLLSLAYDFGKTAKFRVILLSLLTLTSSSCKQRGVEAETLSENSNTNVIIDKLVIDQFYQYGTKQTASMQWALNFLRTARTYQDNDERYMGDTFRRELGFIQSLFNVISQFEKGTIAIENVNKVSVSSDSTNRTKDFLQAIYGKLQPASQNANGWPMAYIVNQQWILADIIVLHNQVLAEIKTWRTSAPAQSPVPGQTNGQPGVDGGQPFGSESVSESQGTSGSQSNGGSLSTSSTTDCPRALGQGATYLQRQAYWLKMNTIFQRLSNASTMREASLPKKAAVNVSIKGSMHALPVRSPTPGLCKSQTEAAQCFGQPLISALSINEDLKCLYAASAGVREGYTLGEHTRMMMEIFASQRGAYKTDKIVFKGYPMDYLFPIILALHDIGKPVAVAVGDSKRQHEFSKPIAKAVLLGMGYSEAEAKLAVAMIDQDILGEAMIALGPNATSIDAAVTKSAAALRRYADYAGMPYADFLEAQIHYYVSDAASYPGVQSSVFVNDPKMVGVLRSRNGFLEALQKKLKDTDATDWGTPAPTPVPKGKDEVAARKSGPTPPPPGSITRAMDAGTDYGGLSKDNSGSDTTPYEDQFTD